MRQKLLSGAYKGLLGRASLSLVSQVSASVASISTISLLVRTSTLDQVAAYTAGLAILTVAVTISRGGPAATLFLFHTHEKLNYLDFFGYLQRVLIISLLGSAVSVAGFLLVVPTVNASELVSFLAWSVIYIVTDAIRVLSTVYGITAVVTLASLTYVTLSLWLSVAGSSLDFAEVMYLSGTTAVAATLILVASLRLRSGDSRRGSFWGAQTGRTIASSWEAGVGASGNASIPIGLSHAHPSLAVENQVAAQAVTTPASFLVSGFVPQFQRRLRSLPPGSPVARRFVLKWALFATGVMVLMVSVSVLMPLSVGTRIFGPTWIAARQLLPFRAFYVVYFPVVTALLSERRRGPQFRSLSIASAVIATIVHSCVLIGGILGGEFVLKICFVAAPALGALIWGTFAIGRKFTARDRSGLGEEPR